MKKTLPIKSLLVGSLSIALQAIFTNAVIVIQHQLIIVFFKYLVMLTPAVFITPAFKKLAT